jgi:hypothetical protein
MNFPKYSNLDYIKNLGGSTGARLFKNMNNNEWVVKSNQNNYEQVKYEGITNNIYEALGISVPKHKIDTKNKVLILEYIDGTLLKDVNTELFKKAKEDLKKGFIVDVLLANWDVIGMEFDNIIIPKNGKPAVRIDNGGSLIFRAQGKKKDFTDYPSEINSMRDKDISPQAFKIFGDITEKEIDEQITQILIPNYKIILSLTPKELQNTMSKRIEILILEYSNEKNFDFFMKSILPFQSKEELHINSSQNIVKPVNIKKINFIELKLIKLYTEIFYKTINNFLYTKNYKCSSNKQTDSEFIFNYILKQIFNIDTITFSIFNKKYCERILFESFNVLYKLLQKAPKIKKPFEVWRGVSYPYLQTDKNKIYYFNSFVSTSLTMDLGLIFLNDLDTEKKYLYKFIIYPGCNYLNISNISSYKNEKEVLLAPYHIYSFLGEETIQQRIPKYSILKDITIQTFVIFPSNLKIPHDFESFIKWKEEIVNLQSKHSIQNIKNKLKGKCKRGKTRKIKKSCFFEPIHFFELKE